MRCAADWQEVAVGVINIVAAPINQIAKGELPLTDLFMRRFRRR